MFSVHNHHIKLPVTILELIQGFPCRWCCGPVNDGRAKPRAALMMTFKRFWRLCRSHQPEFQALCPGYVSLLQDPQQSQLISPRASYLEPRFSYISFFCSNQWMELKVLPDSPPTQAPLARPFVDRLSTLKSEPLNPHLAGGNWSRQCVYSPLNPWGAS